MLRSVVMGIVSIVLCSWSEAAVRQTSKLTVIVYNDAGVPDGVVKEAERIAWEIYRKAGLAIEWRDRRGGSELDGVSFFVRIIPNSLNLRGEQFGVAFVGDDGLGVQADVFYSGMEHMSQSSALKLSPAAILGHVMAHELGHLLLGPDSHSNAGIMQAHWTASQFQKISMGRLTFDRNEAEIMRSRLSGPYTTLQSRTMGGPVASVTKASLPQP